MSIKNALTSLIVLIFSAISAHSFANERLVRVAGDPYPPWTEGVQGEKATGGIAVGIIEELFKRLDMETLTFVYPFKRGLERIKQGEEDAILMVSTSEERKQYMSFTVPIRYVKHVFFYSSSSNKFDWQEWEDLKKYTIGNITGYNLGNDWEKAKKQHSLNVEEVKSDVYNADKLLLGRIDAFIADQEVMERFIEENPKYHGKFKWHKKPVYVSVNNFGISKKSFLFPMIPEINTVLEEMKADGTFQEIFCVHGKEFNARCEKN
ncbi:transporter substrate-binding domain-containing protein [Vibrio sp. Of7-15]|uniref:substrate-binding periplasmic protein n=1 Tax=Vibrio sp. Of7-15 TaxID=2724879 RepID=UPI001EF2C5CF|nr:transporter substrate-binding domain-containing protein [Vibrio sp. Of7-15]MCG7495652.1 transporter substrate-binding domain-containing protein [Vibrio sp. Of7-15]